MKWIFSNRMGLNPASVNLKTGVITINKNIWQRLSSVQKTLILLHEEAHYHLQTPDDEIACDRWALERFAGTQKKSLRKAVDAYADLLNKDYIDNERKIQILKSVLAIDAKRFNNPRAQALLKNLENPGREANSATVVVGVVVGIASLVSMVANDIQKNRTEWNKQNDSKKTAFRMTILNDTTHYVILDYIQKNAVHGVNHIQNMVKDRSQLQSDVHATMVKHGVLIPGWLGMKNLTKPSVFFKSNNFGWTREEINQFADKHWADLKKMLIVEGHKDDTPEAAAGGGLTNTTNWLLWGAVAIGGVVLLRKFL